MREFIKDIIEDYVQMLIVSKEMKRKDFVETLLKTSKLASLPKEIYEKLGQEVNEDGIRDAVSSATIPYWKTVDSAKSLI